MKSAVMTVGNVIALVQSSGCWAAKYISGPERDKVMGAFDSDTLPLPYAEEAKPELVRQHVERQYPGAVIFTLTGEYQRSCADAVLIYSGACNPLGISKALATACETSYRASGTGMDHSMVWAPARLIHAQIGHLLKVGFGAYADHCPYTPEDDTAFCERVSGK